MDESYGTYYTSLPQDKGEVALIADLRDLKLASKNRSVTKIIKMLKDLRAFGPRCGHLKHQVNAIYELKARTSEGGVRVYLFRLDESTFVVTRAECKDQNAANPQLIQYTQDVWDLIQKGDYDMLVPKT